MIRVFYFALIQYLVLTSQTSFSQERKSNNKAELFADMSVAIGSVHSEAVSVYRLHLVSKSIAVKIGYRADFLDYLVNRLIKQVH